MEGICTLRRLRASKILERYVGLEPRRASSMTARLAARLAGNMWGAARVSAGYRGARREKGSWPESPARLEQVEPTKADEL
jgi:predicted alpha/beta-hydrolase family hydrolase